MDWLQVAVLALIQGISEFLPISSSAHLILPAQLGAWPDQGLAFDVAVHVGSLSAVCLYFRAELMEFIASAGRLVTTGEVDAHASLLFKLGVATLPIVVAGVLLKDWVAMELRSIVVIATTTIVFGLALWWADAKRGQTTDIGWHHAILIGLAQILAIVPGTSRSGVTITAALLVGLTRVTAARFSFLLSIPTIAGAGLLLTLDAWSAGGTTAWAHLGAGAVLAGVSAYVCIHYFIALVERTGMTPYVIYRLLLGVLLLWIAF